MMELSKRYQYCVFFATAITFSLLSQCLSDSLLTLDEVFSVELLHRDSPRSPYLNKTETRDERANNALARSLLRSKHLIDDDDNPGEEPVSRLRYHSNEYLLNISVGSPPVQITGYFETANNFIWTQCKPCRRCPRQVGPMFDPSKSLTYEDVSCFSRECSWLGETRCDPIEGRICQYYWEFLDGSSTKGNFARDTIRLDSTSGRTLPFDGVMFGCGHDNKFHRYDGSYSGIIGVVGGPFSLLSQLGRAANGKFSYCLLPFLDTMSEKTSRLSFGKGAMVKGIGTACSPIVVKRARYGLTLNAVTIESVDKIDYLAMPINTIGDMYIDAGTTVSYLNKDFYYKLESVVAEHVKKRRVASPVKYLRLCYSSMTESDAPTLQFHFVNANVKLGLANTFFEVVKNVWCFAFAPAVASMSRTRSDSIPQIYGAFQQTNFLVGYDVADDKVICFKKTNCVNFKP